MMLRLLFTILLMTLFLVFTRAQDGTTVSAKQLAFDTNFVDSVSTAYSLDRTFHIALHVVEDVSGNHGVNFGNLETAVDGLNAAFEAIGVNFAVSDTNFIDNYNFNSLNKESNRQTMLTSQHHVKNLINVYLVSSLRGESAQDVCGFTYMPGDSTDHIFIRKNCLQTEILTRQFGHFFNLYNTHETVLGTESIKREDCETKGDRCCDTPADHDLAGLVNSDCQYIGAAKLGDDYYIPHTTNYMSNAPLACRCYFSPDQYVRMINAMVTVKSYLW